MTLTKKRRWFLPLFLGSMTAITPLSLDMYLPLLLEMSGGDPLPMAVLMLAGYLLSELSCRTLLTKKRGVRA